MEQQMTFQQALYRFSQLKDIPFVDEGHVFKTLIVPANEQDRNKYLNYLMSNIDLAENETALQFSLDGLFVIRQVFVDNGYVVSKQI